MLINPSKHIFGKDGWNNTVGIFIKSRSNFVFYQCNSLRGLLTLCHEMALGVLKIVCIGFADFANLPTPDQRLIIFHHICREITENFIHVEQETYRQKSRWRLDTHILANNRTHSKLTSRKSSKYPNLSVLHPKNI